MTQHIESKYFGAVGNNDYGVQEWTPPLMFNFSETADQIRADDLVAENPGIRIHDSLPIVAQSLCEYEHPETKGKPVAQAEYVADVLQQGNEFGVWVYYPWLNVISHLPEKDDYRKLFTSRDRLLKTDEQQAELYTKTTAFLGLSVGSKGTRACVESSVSGTYILADGDMLDPTNLNRIDAGFPSVGESKISLTAKYISEKDPWLNQIHMSDGLNAENVGELANADLIVEEVDSLPAKALARLEAAKNGTPLIMAADIHDKSVVDVERYDLQDKKKIMFNGKLTEAEAKKIAAGGLTPAENTQYMFKHQGARHLSTRMMRSVMAIGTELSGMPQLGATATRGGANIAFAAREILLGHDIASGRYSDNPRQTFGMPRHEVSPVEGVRTVLKLVKHVRGLSGE